jgi:hypothetical protein
MASVPKCSGKDPYCPVPVNQVAQRIIKMTVIQSLKPAENRARYFSVLRRSVKTSAAPPAMHADNPLLPPEIDDLSNQLHRSFQGFPLKIVIPRFSDADDPGVVAGFMHLTWNGCQGNVCNSRRSTNY